MTERQKECFNCGMEFVAKMHDDAAAQYSRLRLDEDAKAHEQWAKNIRSKYLRTVRPINQYIV